VGLLNRHILLQIAVPSILALGVIAVVAVASEIQDLLQGAPVAQMTLGDLTRLMLYLMPMLVAYVVPITYMMGILLAFGRLSQNGEIVAMKAAGIPLKRIVIPVIVAGGFLSVACFWVQDRVQPWAIHQMYRLVLNDLPARVTLDVLQPGIMHEFRGWRVYIGAKDRQTGALKDIVILKPKDGEQGSIVYHAEEARLVGEPGRMRLEMPHGLWIPSAEGSTVSPVVFDKLSMPLPALKAQTAPETPKSMTVRRLLDIQRDREATGQKPSEVLSREIMKERQEIAERLSLPFACLAVSFLAAPLGARAKRSGRSYTFAVGFGIILCYYVLRLLVEPGSLHRVATVVSRAWVPNLALCAAGVFFVWRVDRV